MSGEYPEITQGVAAIRPSDRPRALVECRRVLRLAWRNRNAKVIRETMPHHAALDWLVNHARPFGQLCTSAAASECIS